MKTTLAMIAGCAITLSVAVAAKDTSTITPEEYNTATCKMIMDLMERSITNYELQLRRLQEENRQLRNALESEET